MNKFFLIFVTLCACLWTINEASAQTATCVYYYKYHIYFTTGYNNINNTHYTCDLHTEQAGYYGKLIRIDGQHLTGHSDADVKFIGGDEMKIFSSIFCQKFPNLEYIDMNNAELEFIDEDSMINCKNLDKLFLYENKIREIPENLLIQSSKLTYFWIYNNQLTTLPENLFLNQKKLESLGLQNNQINFLPSNIFRSLVKLEVLYLHYNKLKSINADWFVALQNLKWLSLEGNKISEISSKCFASLGKLEKLWLNKNGIKTLKSDSFDGLQELQFLNLDSNEISDLSAGVFTKLKNLQILYLSDNKLTTIHSDSFGIHNQLTTIFLNDNKINAIYPNFLDNKKLSAFYTRNNICCKEDAKYVNEFKSILKICFDNYQPRSQFQIQTHNSGSLSANTCGKSKTGHSNIIGGTYINSGDYPWIAALLFKNDKFFCGGTLVSSQKIVTAAHCIQEKKSKVRLSAGDVKVLLGGNDLSQSYEIGRISYAIQAVNVHPDWNTFTDNYDADIAVLVLEIEVTFNRYIQPICLPVQNSNIATIGSGSVVGYGKSEDDTKQHENIPKIIKTPIHNNNDCFAANGGLNLLSSGRTFCGGSGRGVGVCNGDSGSGLVVFDGSSYYLRGVVSSSLFNSYKGCNVNTYSIFTDVLKFIDWINGISTDRFAVRRKK